MHQQPLSVENLRVCKACKREGILVLIQLCIFFSLLGRSNLDIVKLLSTAANTQATRNMTTAALALLLTLLSPHSGFMCEHPCFQHSLQGTRILNHSFSYSQRNLTSSICPLCYCMAFKFFFELLCILTSFYKEQMEN